MRPFWKTEGGRLRIGVLALLVLFSAGTVYDFATRQWDATTVLVLPLFIFGMTAMATARGRMPAMSPGVERLRSPLYAAGVVALLVVGGLLFYEFLWGFLHGYRSAAGTSAPAQR